MSSQRKIEANRANGARSHGPKTPEGLKTSSMNALRYGLFAQTVVLSNESVKRFQALAQTYLDKFKPTDEVEHDLVEDMIVAKWRQFRLWGIETAALDFTMDAQEPDLAAKFSTIDEPTRLALAHKEAMGQLACIERCESSYRRQYDRAMKNLLQLRLITAPPVQPSAAPPQPSAPEPLRNEPTAPNAVVRNEPTTPVPFDPIGMNEDEIELFHNLSPRLRSHIYGDEAA